MNQLTPDFEGTLPYNNEHWIDFRIKMENYLNQTSDMLSKFAQLQIELSSFEQPETRETCQEAILVHANAKQRVFGINIEQLIGEGRSLLRALVGHESHEMLLGLVPGGTRDSGYSGSESEKFNYDYFGEASKIKEPIEQLRAAKQKVQGLWQQKKLKLEQCLQLRIFEQDCSQVINNFITFKSSLFINFYLFCMF